jgi:hypothetical protein
VTTNWKDVARATLEGSESGTTTFPQNLRDLMEAGFDGYAVDFRRSTTVQHCCLPSSAECRRSKHGGDRSHSERAQWVRTCLHTSWVVQIPTN